MGIAIVLRVELPSRPENHPAWPGGPEVALWGAMRSSLVLSGLLAALASGCFYVDGPAPSGPGPSSGGTITIDNASSYVLTEIRVTQVNNTNWGPNMLGSDVLYPDERLTVSVRCATYDVLISDEAGRDCVLTDLDLCFSDQLWVIDNSTLRYCGF